MTTPILPDDSSFFVASFPLPEDHWIYSKDEHQAMPQVYIQTNRDVIRNAAKWAIKACTYDGKDMDFDPDALVNSLVRAICGQSVATAFHSNEETI